MRWTDLWSPLLSGVLALAHDWLSCSGVGKSGQSVSVLFGHAEVLAVLPLEASDCSRKINLRAKN